MEMHWERATGDGAGGRLRRMGDEWGIQDVMRQSTWFVVPLPLPPPVPLSVTCSLPFTFPLLCSFFSDGCFSSTGNTHFAHDLDGFLVALFSFFIPTPPVWPLPCAYPSLVFQPRRSPLELCNHISVQLHLHQPLSPPTVPVVSPLGSLRLCSAVKLVHWGSRKMRSMQTIEEHTHEQETFRTLLSHSDSKAKFTPKGLTAGCLFIFLPQSGKSASKCFVFL